MAHTINIVDIETSYSQAAQGDVLDVSVEVFNDEVSEGIRRFGFSINATSEEILDEMAHLAATLDSDEAVGLASAAHEASLENVQLLRETLL